MTLTVGTHSPFLEWTFTQIRMQEDAQEEEGEEEFITSGNWKLEGWNLYRIVVRLLSGMVLVIDWRTSMSYNSV